MTLKQLILQLVQIAILFAFPAIWNWLLTYIPCWPFDPQTTLGIITGIVITLVSWLLGYVGIRRLVTTLKTQGFAATTSEK
ncbi:MAG: hypothetical protein ONB05_02425 [candidate division KSB1 bacterium]|nr:hypothetical protein [candidate division KSB1 bacterium]